MAKQPEDRARLVAAAANRLRLIQIDFADESPEVRGGYLTEAIEGALGEVLPEQRDAFLKELMARFPTWDPNLAIGAPRAEAAPAQAATLSRSDERELQDPSFLVSRLVDMAPQLTDEQRHNLLARLRGAGLLPPPLAALPEEPLQYVRQALGLPPDAALDTARLLVLLGALADFVSSLDPLVWRTWGKLAPTSRFQGVAALRLALSRYVVSGGTVTDAQAEEELLKLRHLIASVVVAVGQAGKIAATDVVTSFMAPLAPAKIHDLVRFEKGSIFVAEEVKCWRKYKDLAGRITDTAVETAINEKIQRFIEELMKRRSTGRSGSST